MLQLASKGSLKLSKPVSDNTCLTVCTITALPPFFTNTKKNPKCYITRVYKGGLSTYKDICLPIHHQLERQHVKWQLPLFSKRNFKSQLKNAITAHHDLSAKIIQAIRRSKIFERTGRIKQRCPQFKYFILIPNFELKKSMRIEEQMNQAAGELYPGSTYPLV